MNLSEETTTRQRHRVVIVGGGLAGIAAAEALSSLESKSLFDVSLLESRPQLGGRATSYTDRETGETIDNCQHVSMRCCTNLQRLCRQLGIADAFQTESQLEFIAPDGTQTAFNADPLPAPFHLTRAFLRLPYLSWKEKIRFAMGVRSLARASTEELRGRRFADWLHEHHQSDSLIQNVWDVVLVSALSESLDRIDAAYARKVFVDGFLSHADGWKVEIPKIDLDELYSIRTVSALNQRGVTIQNRARVSEILFEEKRGTVVLNDGESIDADHVILAVPQHQVPSLLPNEPLLQELIAKCQEIETAPITSVHLWYDKPVMPLPHAVLVGRLGQWAFNRGERMLQGNPAYYCQVVISASRQLKEQTQEDVIQKIDQELQEIWQTGARLIHSRIITERRAVFSVTPGIDQFRPAQQTPVPHLQVAGDWTRTGWPATMEGAVISGYLAAENVCRHYNLETRFVQPGLPVSLGSRWLLGVNTSPEI